MSIPLQRLVKTHLSNKFLKTLSKNSDILIISPFSDNIKFQENYKYIVKYFIKYEKINNFFMIKSFIHLIIKTMRVNGYWNSNPTLMNYYILNQYTKFRNNGEDKKINIINRFGINILGLFGKKYKSAWKILAKWMLINRSLSDQIIKITSHYEKIVLLQASTWGEQDLELSVLRRKNKWDSIFVPYTTDQLLCNGWLYDDYKYIFVQGPLEKHYALNLHKIPECKIVEFGSLNSRILSTAQDEIKITDQVDKQIIYAGSIDRYFPLKSELNGLETILQAQISGELPKIEVTYRSFGENKPLVEKIISKYTKTNIIKVQYVTELFAGLNNYGGEITNNSLKEYIGNIKKGSILVSVGCTSLSLDAAFLGVPTISYWEDNTGVLERRKIKELFSGEKKLRDLYKDVPATFTKDELVNEINYILTDKEKVKKL